jgi:hypothetical protein
MVYILLLISPICFSFPATSVSSFHCQNDCRCRADIGDGATLMVADSVAPTTNASLPEVCADSPVVMATDVGWCEGGVDYFVGYYDTALDCWDACWYYTHDQTW